MTLAAKDVRGVWDGDLVDADVHIAASLEALQPHLSRQWREFMRERGFRSWGGVDGLRRVYPPSAASTMPAWQRADGLAPGSTLALLREDLLDPLAVDAAVVNCYFAVDSIRHPDFAAALAAAVNDWLVEEWLAEDPRLRASLVVPARDPDAAIAEIERVGGHPGFVQVLMPVHADRLYGKRTWHRMLDAVAARDLVLGLHVGGTGDAAPTPAGYPNHYFTEYVAEPTVFWAQMTSLIAEGAFQEVPALRVSILEAGFTWLPSLAWRLTKEWKGLRRDIPWVGEPPADLIRRHFRCSAAPIDGGDASDLAATIKYLGTDELLMFATDFPHWHDDDVGALLEATPAAARPKLMAGNARSWYRL